MTSSSDTATKLAMIAGTISNSGIRDFTIEMMRVAPESFRTARASRSNHPPDEREPGGNALHTLRVVKLVRLMADACDYGRLATDILISAAIIHDICRYGLDDTDEATSKDHALYPRQLAERYSVVCEHSESIFNIAENHMGKWGPVPHKPQITPSDIIHIADMVSAHANEVWEQLEAATTSWVSGVPFEEQGMTQEMMDRMEELAEESDYWKTAFSFVKSVSSRKLSTLSEKQRDWLDNIIDSLEKELIEE